MADNSPMLAWIWDSLYQQVPKALVLKPLSKQTRRYLWFYFLPREQTLAFCHELPAWGITGKWLEWPISGSPAGGLSDAAVHVGRGGGEEDGGQLPPAAAADEPHGALVLPPPAPAGARAPAPRRAAQAVDGPAPPVQLHSTAAWRICPLPAALSRPVPLLRCGVF